MRCMAACRLLFAAAGKPNKKSSLHFIIKDATDRYAAPKGFRIGSAKIAGIRLLLHFYRD